MGDVISDENLGDRQARQPARRRRRATIAATRHSMDDLRERLAEIEARLPDLRRLHEQQGDALAGRLFATLERERADILVQVGATRARRSPGSRDPGTRG